MKIGIKLTCWINIYNKQEVLQLACALAKRWNLNYEIRHKMPVDRHNVPKTQPQQRPDGSTQSLKDAAKALAALNEKLKNLKI